MKQMLKLKYNYLNIILILLFAGTISAQTYNKPGVTSAQFLKLGITARGEAMSQAVIADVSDASSVFYNPAGLINIKRNNLVVSYSQLPADVNLSFAGFGKKLGEDDAIAVSVISLRTDEMIERTILNPEGTGRKFVYANYAFGASYAHNFTMDLTIGFTLKYLWLNPMSGVFSKSSWSGDMGLQYKTSFKGILKDLRIGMMVSNFGPEISVVKESYALPLKYTVGIAKPVFLNSENRITLSANWVKALDEQEKTQLGFEYSFSNFIFLRGGYKFASDLQTWSGGVGFVQNISITDLKMDYSYSDFGDLGRLHRFTAIIDF